MMTHKIFINIMSYRSCFSIEVFLQKYTFCIIDLNKNNQPIFNQYRKHISFLICSMQRFVYSSTRLEEGLIIICCIVSGVFTTFCIISSIYFRSYHRCTTFSIYFFLLTRVGFALTNHFCFFLSVSSYELHKTSPNGTQDLFSKRCFWFFLAWLSKTRGKRCRKR